MNTKVGFLSIVIPFFNEEENVHFVITELEEEVGKLGLEFEIIAVDDGSEDDTWDKLLALRERIPELRLIRLKKNFGQTKAFSVAMTAAKGEWILTMDGDGQNDPSNIPLLIEKAQEGFDVVSGWRKNRKDSKLLRTIPSRAANWILTRITGLKLHDSGCSLKLYKAQAIKSISLYADRHRFIPFLLHMKGFHVTEVAVNHRPRVRGKSKYGLSRTIKVVLDLIGLTLFARFRETPRFYFFVVAIPFLIGAVASLLASLSQRSEALTHPNHVTYFGATFLFLYGMLSLVSYGLLAEWLNRFERGRGNGI